MNNKLFGIDLSKSVEKERSVELTKSFETQKSNHAIVPKIHDAKVKQEEDVLLPSFEYDESQRPIETLVKPVEKPVTQEQSYVDDSPSEEHNDSQFS